MLRRIMGKQGPCCHCGISTTPLWRNGPEEKPVLCNACGSRWRTKGTLFNYMPMHAGGLGLKNGSMQKPAEKINEVHPRKRKEPSSGFSEYRFYPGSDYHANSSLADDDSVRLSSGSRISLSDSCAQHTPKADKGTECWPPWGFHVPSKRRTAMLHHRHFIKRFSSLPTSESFSCRCTSEEDLLVDYKPLLTTEIGLGGVFIRPSPSRPPAQESQASSIGYNNEMHEAVTLKATSIREGAIDIPLLDQSIKHKRKEKTNQLARNIGVSRTNVSKGWMPNKALLSKFPYSKREVLQSCHSPLAFVELKDIVNYDTFMGLLSDEEQQQLVEHVSPVDADLEGLRCMFSCVQFESFLRLFQTLLSEGMFDSDSGLSPGVLQHYRHLLTLSDLRASGWIERCSTFSNRAKRKGIMDCSKITQDKEYLKEKMKSSASMGLNQLLPGGTEEATHVPAGDFCFVSAEKGKRTAAGLDFKAQTSLDSWSMFSDVTYDEKVKPTSRQRQNSLERDGIKGGKKCCMHLNNKSIKSRDRIRTHYQRRERPTSSYTSIDEAIYGVIQENDILLDLPSNVSFQQAELLQKPVWTSKLLPREVEGIQKQTSDDLIVKNVWSPTEPNSDLTGLWNSPSEFVNHTLQ